MKETVISVTEAARNFADCVNRVRYHGMTFVLLKNGSPVARLVPDNLASTEESSSVRKLAADLRKFNLSPEEAKAWRRDMRKGHRILKPPIDKWR
jgi:prevent-host-death family protein